jgi:hypothetical protein
MIDFFSIRFVITDDFEEGSLAFRKIKDIITSSDPKDIFVFDFDGVIVLEPSYCDEVFGNLQGKFSSRIQIKNNIGHALKVAFDTVEETRGIKFQFIK